MGNLNGGEWVLGRENDDWDRDDMDWKVIPAKAFIWMVEYPGYSLSYGAL